VIRNGSPPDIRALATVHEAFESWLAFPTDDARPRYDLIDIALAVIIANRMDGDPLWLFLVAPPSSGKTEIIRSLSDVPDVFPLSSLTAQTFASGFERKGVETSLLPKINDKTIVMKDFGTVLTMYREKRPEILAQLREIYDGSFAKEWGNGKSLAWTGKVGLLAGVTGAIDREYSLGTILGERFLMYRVKGAPASTIAGRAIAQNAMWEKDQRQALRSIVATYLEGLLPVAPPMPEALVAGLIALAEFVAKARSPVFFSVRGEIELIPEPEAPGRLAKQLYLLARALAVVRQEGEVSVPTYNTVVQVANDTLPATRQEFLQAVLAHDIDATTTVLAEGTNYPTASARRYLQELAAVKLVTRTAEGQGKADRWRPSDLLLALLETVRRPCEDPDLFKSVRESVIRRCRTANRIRWSACPRCGIGGAAALEYASARCPARLVVRPAGIGARSAGAMRRLAEVDAGEPVMPKVRSADALDGPYPALKRCWQIATTCDGCGGSGSDKRQVRTIGRSARPVACGARLSSPRTTATAYTGRGVNVGHRWPANWGGVEEGRERLGCWPALAAA
jgi:hypothetical protein